MAEIATKEVVSLTHLQKQGHGQAAVQMLGLLELSVLVHFRCAVISNMAITKTQYGGLCHAYSALCQKFKPPGRSQTHFDSHDAMTYIFLRAQVGQIQRMTR